MLKTHDGTPSVLIYTTGRYITHLKVKVKVNFTLEQATNAQRGSRGIAPLIL